MEGECEKCGEMVTLNCCYCEDTGQELYLCNSCERNMSEEDKHNLADE